MSDSDKHLKTIAVSYNLSGPDKEQLIESVKITPQKVEFSFADDLYVLSESEKFPNILFNGKDRVRKRLEAMMEHLAEQPSYAWLVSTDSNGNPFISSVHSAYGRFVWEKRQSRASSEKARQAAKASLKPIPDPAAFTPTVDAPTPQPVSTNFVPSKSQSVRGTATNLFSPADRKMILAANDPDGTYFKKLEESAKRSHGINSQAIAGNTLAITGINAARNDQIGKENLLLTAISDRFGYDVSSLYVDNSAVAASALGGDPDLDFSKVKPAPATLSAPVGFGITQGEGDLTTNWKLLKLEGLVLEVQAVRSDDGWGLYRCVNHSGGVFKWNNGKAMDSNEVISSVCSFYKTQPSCLLIMMHRLGIQAQAVYDAMIANVNKREKRDMTDDNEVILLSHASRVPIVVIEDDENKGLHVALDTRAELDKLYEKDANTRFVGMVVLKAQPLYLYFDPVKGYAVLKKPEESPGGDEPIYLGAGSYANENPNFF